MSRFQALLIEFGGIDIPLSIIADKYLGMGERQADMKASKHELPFKTYRIGGQKSPRMVSAADLAGYIDGVEKRAATEHEQFTSHA